MVYIIYMLLMPQEVFIIYMLSLALAAAQSRVRELEARLGIQGGEQVCQGIGGLYYDQIWNVDS